MGPDSATVEAALCLCQYLAYRKSSELLGKQTERGVHYAKSQLSPLRFSIQLIKQSHAGGLNSAQYQIVSRRSLIEEKSSATLDRSIVNILEQFSVNLASQTTRATAVCL
jgi:hypothetical protein